MAIFNYKAKTKDAKTVIGKEEASSKNELISQLRGKGLFIVAIEKERQKKETLKSTYINKKGKRNSLKLSDLTLLARNLATMLSSGVTLLRTLDLVSNQTESLKLGKVLKKCSQDVRDGLSFGEAVKKYPGVFSNLWAGIVQVGEASGNLPFVLEKLADYLELRMEFERKIKSALVYPMILVVAATLAIFAFVKFIFPKFKELFTQFDIELPALTKSILLISGFLEKNFWFILIGVIVLIFVFKRLKKREDVKKIIDKFLLKIPLLGSTMFLIYIERFTSTIHILLESGLPLVYTLEAAARSIGNSVLQNQLFSAAENVKEGASLSGELAKLGAFPTLVTEMAKIGEETGSMPDVFSKVSSHYRKELTTKVERVIAAFEPLMIIFMGIVIGVIVISLFLPLFKISTLQ
jgi:type IV pilus assembly protein PilC